MPEPHELATTYLPFFVTAPGEGDVLFNIVTVIVCVVVLLLGVFYFTLHAIPERWVGHENPLKLQIVAVLSLVSLFTHDHIYWIIALVLASIQIPDIWTPLRSLFGSIGRSPDPGPPASPLEKTSKDLPQNAERSNA